MKQEHTYYQDTIVKIPLKENIVNPGEGSLNDKFVRSTLPALPESRTAQRDSVIAEKQEQQVLPTPEQIRYWWWQREKKIVVGESRYIQPNHSLKVHSSVPSEKTTLVLPERKVQHTNTDWQTLLLAAGFILIASIRTTWGKYLASLFKSVVNYSTSVRMFKEKNSSVIYAATRLDALFFLVFPIFMFQLTLFFNINLPFHNIYLYLLSLFVLAVFIISKKLFYNTLGHILDKSAETSEFLFNLDNFNRVMGLALLPVATIIIFYPSENLQVPVIFGVILVVFLYLKLLYRGFKVLITKQFSIFYLFLYFCTLEILPLVLLYKIMIEQMEGVI
jgi:hypothetical protein